MDVGCEFAEYVVKDSAQSVIIQQQILVFWVGIISNGGKKH